MLILEGLFIFGEIRQIFLQIFVLVIQLRNLVNPFFALIRYFSAFALEIFLQIVLHLDRQRSLFDIVLKFLQFGTIFFKVDLIFFKFFLQLGQFALVPFLCRLLHCFQLTYDIFFWLFLLLELFLIWR